MPLVTVTLRHGKSGEFKQAVLAPCTRARRLRRAGEGPLPSRAGARPDDFRYDADYPDLAVRAPTISC